MIDWLSHWVPFLLFYGLVTVGVLGIANMIFPPPPKHDHPFPHKTITHAHKCPKGQEFHTHDAQGRFIPVAPIQQVQHFHHITTTDHLGADVEAVYREGDEPWRAH